MKYASPKYENAIIETKDVITASGEKFQVEENENGTGNVIMKALDIFK